MPGQDRDKTDIRPPGQKQIEPCDIYTVIDDRAALVHVKISTSSSELSHLFNQGANSAELLKTDDDAPTRLVARLGDKRKHDDDLNRLVRPAEAGNFMVFFAIITTKDPAKKSLNLPLFSRISLARNIKALHIRPSNATSADCVVCGIDFNESDAVRVSVAKTGADPVFACAGVCADRMPCPVCGVAAASAASTNDDVVTAPRFTTPWQRIRGLANVADIDVYEIPSEECGDDFAGAVSVGFDVEGQIHGQIGLADDLDEDLCTDVLAFAIALYVDVDVPEEARSFHLHADELHISVLRPGESVKIRTSATMGGGKSVFDLTLSGDNPDGERLEFPSKISL